MGRGHTSIMPPWHEQPARWFLWLPAALGLGIALYFELPHEPPALCFALTPLAALCLLAARRYAGGRAVAAAVLMMALGLNAAMFSAHLRGTPQIDTALSTGVAGVVTEIDTLPSGQRVLLRVGHVDKLPPHQWPRFVRLKISQPVTVQVGQRMRVFARLNPLSQPVVPDGYDFRRAGFFEGLGAIGWSLAAPEIAPSPSHNYLAEHWRETMGHAVRAQLSGDTASITAALLNGEQIAISDDTLQAMRASGLQHILSISGLHLAVVAALCFVFLRQLLACVPFLALNFPIKKWAAAGALLSIVVYTWLTGAQIPTLRAMLMAGVVFVAVMADRRALTLRTLALAAILLLIIKPFALYSASFQLSFAAMLALLAWYERSGKNPPRGLWQKIGLFFAGLLITSLLATMATAPLTLYHFQQFSLYGVLANVVGVPLTTFIIMPAALLVYVLQPLGLHAWALAIMGWGVDILMIIATAVAALPHAMMTHSAPPPVVLPLLVAGGLWIGIWQTFWRWWGIFPIVIAGLITGLHTPPNFYAAEGGKVWALYHQPTHTLYFSGARHDSFIITQWWQRWGRPARITATQAPDDVLICHDGLCRTRMQALPPPHNWLAMPATADALKVACGRAHTLITPQAVDAAAPCQAAHALDETFFSAHNNVSLSWADGRLIITPSPLHHRPWSYNK